MTAPLQVFKFGGASLRDPGAIRQVARIISAAQTGPLVIVVSAMGKTTNALEAIWKARLAHEQVHQLLHDLILFHAQIVREVFPEPQRLMTEIERILEQQSSPKPEGMEADRYYDQVVVAGELVSSLIVSEFLRLQGIEVVLHDARDFVVTDNAHREAAVDWTATRKRISGIRFPDSGIVVTQGYIGSTAEGASTTLGRDGSDFSAAIFATSLGASAVTIWKDVPGVMNADPKRIPDAIVFPELPYQEAAEMTYYGASVIHPKTIKPLANRSIPLKVRSFEDPSLPGTLIHECRVDRLPPLIVFKEHQCLISCKVTDYTFVTEDQLKVIFGLIAAARVRINVMQNSAISFSFCVDFREDKILALIDSLSGPFEVYYNTGLTLITVKNYTEALRQQYSSLPAVLLEQSSRSTMQVLVRMDH